MVARTSRAALPSVSRTALIAVAAVGMLGGLSACKSDDAASTAAATSGTALPKVAAPAGTTWATTVATTPDGGMVVGNPNAPVKLVEYGSLTCSHCADFAKASKEELMGPEFVGSGRVSFEFRNFVRDPVDAMAAAVTHCAGKDRYFALTDNTFMAQADLLKGAMANPDAGQEIMKLPENQRLTSLAKTWGIDQFFAARGVPVAEVQKCLANPENIGRLEAMTKAGMDKFQLTGTPSFVLNGARLDTSGQWSDVKAKLQAAGVR